MFRLNKIILLNVYYHSLTPFSTASNYNILHTYIIHKVSNIKIKVHTAAVSNSTRWRQIYKYCFYLKCLIICLYFILRSKKEILLH